MTAFTYEQAIVIGQLVSLAQGQPDGRLDITDPTGALAATLQAHQIAKRPKDLPRHLRPKRKLSKRQRVAARREKLRVPVA